MKACLTIIRYKTWATPFAFISMALFHFPLKLNKKIHFYKLMGSGKNGTFDKTPDLGQWAILSAFSDYSFEKNIQNTHFLGAFINGWIKWFSIETGTFVLEPITGHGLWDKKEVFGKLSGKKIDSGPIATLTRATIRLNRMAHFWRNVAPVAAKMPTAKGYLYSIGIGEVPWIKQATFSVWESEEDMKLFAYSMKEHSEVIKKTRQQQWYSEDMFVRFKIIDFLGSINGKDPLKRK